MKSLLVAIIATNVIHCWDIDVNRGFEPKKEEPVFEVDLWNRAGGYSLMWTDSLTNEWTSLGMAHKQLVGPQKCLIYVDSKSELYQRMAGKTGFITAPKMTRFTGEATEDIKIYGVRLWDNSF